MLGEMLGEIGLWALVLAAGLSGVVSWLVACRLGRVTSRSE